MKVLRKAGKGAWIYEVEIVFISYFYRKSYFIF